MFIWYLSGSFYCARSQKSGPIRPIAFDKMQVVPNRIPAHLHRTTLRNNGISAISTLIRESQQTSLGM